MMFVPCTFLSCLIALAAFLGQFGCNQSPRTVDDVIARNTEAMGGEKAIESIHSIAVDLHIVDPGFTVDGSYRAARPGRMRIDVKVEDKPVFTEAFDGERAWQWKGEGSTTVEESPKATAVLRRGVELPGHLYGLHELRQRGHRIDLLGREKIEGIEYYALRITLNDGYQTTLYVDPFSWLITRRRDVRPLHIDIDPTPTTIEQRMSDFRQVAGIWFSYANAETDLQTGKLLETTTVRTVSINPKVEEKVFREL
ncbi:MAG: hypothetical protein QOE26_2350 [Verrucomicrobiota bacterium]|jgi:hypothetical protein